MSYDQQILRPEMFEWLVALLGRHDPMGVTNSPKTDREEYAVEVNTIIPRLHDLMDNVDRRHPLRWSDIRDVVWEEMKIWFGDEAGCRQQYELIAQEIYGVLQVIDKEEEVPTEAYVKATKWREYPLE